MEESRAIVGKLSEWFVMLTIISSPQQLYFQRQLVLMIILIVNKTRFIIAFVVLCAIKGSNCKVWLKRIVFRKALGKFSMLPVQNSSLSFLPFVAWKRQKQLKPEMIIHGRNHCVAKLKLKGIKQWCLVILYLMITYRNFLGHGGICFKNSGRSCVETGFQVPFKKLSKVVDWCSDIKHKHKHSLTECTEGSLGVADFFWPQTRDAQSAAGQIKPCWS